MSQHLFSFEDITLRVRTLGGPRIILHGISGFSEAGDMMAILGPSGCGKSSLLEILAANISVGRQAPSEELAAASNSSAIAAGGRVLLKGESIGTLNNYRKRVAYVMQDDVFVPVLTVRETLLFYARLRLHDSARASERVAQLLKAVRLDHVADVPVGGLLPGGFSTRGISGGEKRRLTIACAIVADPEVLLLDEPTSGLDAENALAIIKLLHSFTQRPSAPCAVVCAIHQPRSSVFHLFSSVMVLSRGRALYTGAPARLVTHFQTLSSLPIDDFTSPADYALDAVAVIEESTSKSHLSVSVESAVDIASVNASHKDITVPLTAITTVDSAGASAAPLTSELKQAPLLQGEFADALVELPFSRRLSVLLSRASKYFARNPGNIIARLIVTLFLGILIGLIYYNTANTAEGAEGRLRALFFMCIMVILLPFQTITLFQDMRQYFLRERSNRLYHSLEYFLANFIMEVSVVMVSTILFVIPAYWLVGLKQDGGAFLFALVTYFVMYLCSSTFMTVLSNITPNNDLAFASGAFFISIFFLFSGFFVLLPNLPTWLSWIPYITWVKYGFQAVVINEFRDRSFGSSLISSLDFDKNPSTMGGALAITITWFIIFAAQSLLALHYFPRIRTTNIFRRLFGG